jgi:LuxR family maltose regulon positive regulatory protein
VESSDRSAAVGASAVPAARDRIVSRHALSEQLHQAARVTQITAPIGSGKTFLLRSWIREAGLADSTAWVSPQGAERDPQRFWLSVADALRGTKAGSKLVRPLTAWPDLSGWAVVERLLKDLVALEERLWLVIDDLHELDSAEALRQLELLLMRAPPELRFVLATRHDLRLGLHRLRLEEELTEIRAAELRFTLDEARALFDAAGMEVPDPALALLHERTEGWAAGLRLAALSLAGQPDPERFAAEFSGSERTVAEYLLAEVLDGQSEEVRRLLLRTSVLERVNGPLADLLTGSSGGERVLQDLQEAGVFVVSLDARRSWFRYHRLFADLLLLQLRRSTPDELPALHRVAAEWYAGHGYPVEAVRHAQAAQEWGLAARLLSDHWFGLRLDGRVATARELLSGFPAGVVAADAELAALMAAGELNRGALVEAEPHLALATQGLESVPAERRAHLHLMLAVLRLSLAGQRGDLPAVIEEAQRLLAPADAADAAQLVNGAGEAGGEDLRALALISLGIVESLALPAEEAERHLEQGVALAHRIGRPYVETTGLAHLAMVTASRSLALAVQQSSQAIDLARRHGWTEEPVAAAAYAVLAGAMVWQGRLEEAEPWLEHAERLVRQVSRPAALLTLHHLRGMLQLARGQDQDALGTFRTAERLAELLVKPHPLVTRTQACLLHALVRVGETVRAEVAVAEMNAHECDSGETRIALAVLRLAQHDPRAATAALGPVLDGSAPISQPVWRIEALLLDAVARHTLGDPAAGSALERVLDLAERDGVVFPFLLHPAPELLERHARHRTAHADLISQILSLPPGPGGHEGAESPPVNRGDLGRIVLPKATLPEALTDTETRVLRYLATDLAAPEIASELFVSVNTIRTHMRHIYAKLGAHCRAEAVERACALGLPSGIVPWHERTTV